MVNDTHILGPTYVVFFALIILFLSWLLGFLGVVCSTSQMFNMGFVKLTFWVHPPLLSSITASVVARFLAFFLALLISFFFFFCKRL